MAKEKAVKEKPEKWAPVHKVAMKLLEKSPGTYFPVIVTLYAEGSRVPPADIPEFIEVLKQAHRRFGGNLWGGKFEEAVEALRAQLAEGEEESSE